MSEWSGFWMYLSTCHWWLIWSYTCSNKLWQAECRNTKVVTQLNKSNLCGSWYIASLDKSAQEEEEARRGMVKKDLPCSSMEINVTHDIDIPFELRFEQVWTHSNHPWPSVYWMVWTSPVIRNSRVQHINQARYPLFPCIMSSRWEMVCLVFEGPVDRTESIHRTELDHTTVQSHLQLQLPPSQLRMAAGYLPL